MKKSRIGERMKAYENAYIGQRTMPLIPTIARLDGKSFHSWTRGLDRPFDHDFMSVMRDVTRLLVLKTNAVIGYTQSDEITLVYYSDSRDSQIFFDGKLYKMTSVLASMCTAFFNNMVNGRLDSKFIAGVRPLAFFDCRVFQVPTKVEAVNCLIWREQDAVRNSIQSVGQSKFSPANLHNKNCSQIQDMLMLDHSINWNDFSSAEKRGTYVRKIYEDRPYTIEEIEKLLEKHEARKNPGLLVKRFKIETEHSFPVLTKIKNRVEVIFDGAAPVLFSEEVKSA